jgi:hypothetical protein
MKEALGKCSFLIFTFTGRSITGPGLGHWGNKEVEICIEWCTAYEAGTESQRNRNLPNNRKEWKTKKQRDRKRTAKGLKYENLTELGVQNHWVWGLCPSSRTLNYGAETGSVSAFRWREEDIYSVGSLRNSWSQLSMTSKSGFKYPGQKMEVIVRRYLIVT